MKQLEDYKFYYIYTNIGLFIAIIIVGLSIFMKVGGFLFFIFFFVGLLVYFIGSYIDDRRYAYNEKFPIMVHYVNNHTMRDCQITNFIIGIDEKSALFIDENKKKVAFIYSRVAEDYPPSFFDLYVKCSPYFFESFAGYEAISQSEIVEKNRISSEDVSMETHTNEVTSIQLQFTVQGDVYSISFLSEDTPISKESEEYKKAMLLAMEWDNRLKAIIDS